MSEENSSLQKAGSCQERGREATKLGVEKDGLGEVVRHVACHCVCLDETQEDVQVVDYGRFLRKGKERGRQLKFEKVRKLRGGVLKNAKARIC